MLRQRVLEALVVRDVETPLAVAEPVVVTREPPAPKKAGSAWVTWTSVATSLVALVVVVLAPPRREETPIAPAKPVERVATPAPRVERDTSAQDRTEEHLIDLELDLARKALEDGDLTLAKHWTHKARTVSRTGVRWRAIEIVQAEIEERERRAPAPVVWSDIPAPIEPPAPPSPPVNSVLAYIHEGPDDPDAFFIQKDPVTNADYKKFVADGGYTDPENWEDLDPATIKALANGPCRWNHGVSSADDDAPVRDVTWREARAYARWLSRSTGGVYRLPTEKERAKLHLSAWERDRMNRAESAEGETSQHLEQGFRLVRVPR